MFTKSNWSMAIRARLRDQLSAGRYLWIGLFVLVAVTGACLAFPQAWLSRTAMVADRIRWAGMFLQIAGVLCVIGGLNDAKTFFGQSGLAGSAWTWVKNWVHVFDKPKTHNVSVTIALPSLTMKATAGVIRANPTIESRLADIESDMGKLRAQVEKGFDQLRAHATDLANREREERSAAVQQTSEKLKSVMTSGIGLQFMGAIFLLSGIAFGSIPEELAHVFP